MRPLLLIAILLMTSSCGLILDGDVKEGQTRQFSETDKTLLPYVVAFEEQAKVQLDDENFKVGDVPINFGDTTDTRYDGVCVKYPDGTREILLKKKWFDRASEVQKEILIYHELGHCRLNRKHNSSSAMAYDNHLSIKVSIMNPVVPSAYYYSEYRDAYLKELFHQDTSELELALEATNSENNNSNNNTETTETSSGDSSVQGGISPIECPHGHHY
jgi:hypothetical protein